MFWLGCKHKVLQYAQISIYMTPLPNRLQAYTGCSASGELQHACIKVMSMNYPHVHHFPSRSWAQSPSWQKGSLHQATCMNSPMSAQIFPCFGTLAQLEGCPYKHPLPNCYYRHVGSAREVAQEPYTRHQARHNRGRRPAGSWLDGPLECQKVQTGCHGQQKDNRQAGTPEPKVIAHHAEEECWLATPTYGSCWRGRLLCDPL